MERLSGVLQGFEDDLVAQGFELSDRAGFGFGRCLPGEVVGSGVFVEFAGGEHVPGRGEHGVFDPYECFHRSAPGGEASVLCGEVGVL